MISRTHFMAFTVFFALMFAAPTWASATTVAKSRGYKIHVVTPDVKAGQASSFQVILEAKEGYEICQKFDHTLRVNAPSNGVTLTQSRLKARASAKNKSVRFDSTRKVTFTVRFEATKRGQFKLPASLRLSVLNSSETLTNKREFTIKLKVD